jgi:hypothetical protein
MTEHDQMPKLEMGLVHVFKDGGKGRTPDDDAVIHLSGDDDSEIRVQCPNAPGVAAEIVRRWDSHDALVAALKGMVKNLVDLGNSGDAGFWDPEKVDEIIAARAALAAAQKKDD